MLLLWAVVVGLALGGIRAIYYRRPLNTPDLHLLWLVPLAFLPQWLIFFLPLTRELASKEIAIFALVASQLLLLIFALYNRTASGFWLLILGLLLNVTVIVSNGGLMPIAPDTMERIAPAGTPVLEMFPPGMRLGTTKDIVLYRADTHLWWLSDVLLFPRWFPWQFAYSIGDVFIAAGVIWLLWQSGRDSTGNVTPTETATSTEAGLQRQHSAQPHH